MQIDWLSTRGTSRHESLCSSDGFRGEHPFASVAIVAEGTGGDRRSSDIATSIIRDVFAEGVAYRVGEALSEAFSEAGDRIRAEELRGCSATAVALLGREAWVVHAGGCRAWLVGPGGARILTGEHTLAGEMGLSPGDPGYRQRSRDLTLQLGQKDLKPQALSIQLGDGECIFIGSSAVWRHFDQARLPSALVSKRGISSGLDQVLRESKARFRRQGGAAAAVSPGEGREGKPARRRRAGLLAALFALLVAATAIVVGRPSCGGGPQPPASAPDSGSLLGIPTILPIPDSAGAVEPAHAGPDLPVAAVVFGGSPAPAGPDTLTVYSTLPPDTLYEKLERGVYYVSADSLLAPLASALASRLGYGAPVGLTRIIVVREADVPSFAAWLPRMDSAEADSTAIVVETRSSVAGGASWIRDYAIYANGDRSRRDEPSCYFGEPLEGLPAEHDSSCYRILCVP